MRGSWKVRAEDYKLKLGKTKRRLKHYRCGQCRGRRTLAKELWDYERPPACKRCGAVDWRMDLSRYSEMVTGTGVFDTCFCDGFPYPHRSGSCSPADGFWCRHHPTGPTDEQIAEYDL